MWSVSTILALLALLHISQKCTTQRPIRESRNGRGRPRREFFRVVPADESDKKLQKQDGNSGRDEVGMRGLWSVVGEATKIEVNNSKGWNPIVGSGNSFGSC